MAWEVDPLEHHPSLCHHSICVGEGVGVEGGRVQQGGCVQPAQALPFWNQVPRQVKELSIPRRSGQPEGTGGLVTER